MMKQLRCKECGTVYSAQREYCPECGCPSNDATLLDDGEDVREDTKDVYPSASDDDNQEEKGYVDVDSDNVFVGIFHWLTPKSNPLPYNSKKMKVTVAVDNDSEDVFEIEKSLFYILQAFSIKLFFCYLAFFLIVGLVTGAIVTAVYRSCDAYGDYEMASFILTILGIILVIFCIIVCFMIFLYVFRPYWSHIHVRLRDLHIRHWRNVYRAIKKEEK